MLNQNTIIADTAAIRADLEYMTARWHELPEPAMFELRAFGEGLQTKTAKFAPDWMDDAVSWAASMNALGFNIYAVRNPIRANFSGSAKDPDITAAFFLWADCDDDRAAGNVLRFDGPKWSAAVTTGRTPGVRVHTYWQLKEPCYDMAEWRAMQVTIAQHFASDASVINPSRIMRVGGTVSYPDSRKQSRGYTNEVVTLRTQYDDARAPVTLEQMARVFGERTPAKPAPSPKFEIDTGGAATKTADDYADILRRARTDGEKHGGVRDLTASLAGSGVPRHFAEAIVRDACPVWDEGVIKLIDTAYAKFAPTKYADPAALTIAPAPDATFDAPARAADLEWFDDIEVSLSANYIVKGVLDQGAMSVVYGPSNSGKTFFALDLAFNIAIGAQWRGRRVKPCPVLYLAAEGGRGVTNRIAALKATTGLCDVPLALKRAGLDLLHAQADLQHICNLSVEVMARKPGCGLLIVIDTLSRVMAGGDENSAADMTALIRNIDAIREATGAHIMLVHHTGKDTARGARGHSSLRAATDTEIEVQTEGESRAAFISKQRDNPGGETFAFTLKSVDLGLDQDGDEVTSCVVEIADSDEHDAAKKAAKGRGKNQQIIMEAFDQMVAEGMALGNPGGVGMPEPGQFWAVDAQELRLISQGKMVGENAAKLFRTAWETLTAHDGVFVTGNNQAWRIDRRKGK